MIREVIVDRIVEVTTGRDDLIAELGTGAGDVAAAIAEIQRMNSEITDLSADVTRLDGEIAGYTDHINDIKAALTRFGPVETNAGRLQRIADLVADLRSANSDLFFQAERIGDALVKAGNIDGYTDDELFLNQDLWQGDNYDNTVPTTAAADNNSTLTIYNDGFGVRVRTADGDPVALISTFGTVESRITQVTQAVEAAYDEGYAAGFSDGYDAGYADGYRDGFRDGVEEVR